MSLYGFGDLSAYGHDWVEGGHGFLEDHGEASPTMAAHGLFRKGEERFPGKGNVSSDLRCRGKEAEEGEGRGGFARAGLSDQTEGFAGVDLERNIFDGLVMPKGDGKIGNIEQRRGKHGLMVAKLWTNCGGMHGKAGKREAIKTVFGLCDGDNV